MHTVVIKLHPTEQRFCGIASCDEIKPHAHCHNTDTWPDITERAFYAPKRDQQLLLKSVK